MCIPENFTLTRNWNVFFNELVKFWGHRTARKKLRELRSWSPLSVFIFQKKKINNNNEQKKKKIPKWHRSSKLPYYVPFTFFLFLKVIFR